MTWTGWRRYFEQQHPLIREAGSDALEGVS